jgi:NADH dehydrogenase (ubiquinone) 1 alpha subcomplex subunit 9
MALALARMGKAVWWPTLSPDGVERRYIDDVDLPGNWDVFDITPEEIEESAIVYLRKFRSAYVPALSFLDYPRSC